MKTRIKILLLLLLPIIGRAQFVSAPQQMQIQNAVNRSMNNMIALQQQQQRDLMLMLNRTLTAKARLAKEEKKNAKLTQKSQEQLAKILAEQDRLTNLQNDTKNTADLNNSQNLRNITEAENNITSF